MVRKCTKTDEKRLIDYLRKDAVYNTFLISDIKEFGFDRPFQTVYMAEEDREVKGVYLCFYQNFILYCHEHQVDRGFLERLFSSWQPDVVMGAAEDVRGVRELLPEYTMEEKDLYLLEHPDRLISPEEDIEQAAETEAEEIFRFLQSIPQLKHLYTSKVMIEDRLRYQKGVHCVIRRDGRIAAHGNSTAEADDTVMIGGVGTAERYRGQQMASQIVSEICRQILQKGKKPCLFTTQEEKHNLYRKIGFEEVGKWATLTRLAPQSEKTETVYRDAQGKRKKLPAYISLYNSLYQELVNGVYPGRSTLPSENELSRRYKVSRNTLRQALAILEQDGYIKKHQGSGTIVCEKEQREQRTDIYNYLMESATEKIREISIDYNIGAPTLIAQEKLKLEDGVSVLASNNVYQCADGPIGQSFVQIPVRELEKYKIGLEDEEGLRQFMNTTIYRIAAYADMTAQLVRADEQVIPYLGIPENTVLMHIEQMLYDEEKFPIARIKYYFCEGKYQIHFSNLTT